MIEPGDTGKSFEVVIEREGNRNVIRLLCALTETGCLNHRIMWDHTDDRAVTLLMHGTAADRNEWRRYGFDVREVP